MTTEEAKKICKLIGCSGISFELCKGHPEDCKIMLLIEIQRKGRRQPMHMMDSIEEKYQEQIAALKIERDLLKKHQAVCECGGLSIDHNISDNHQVSDMPPPCPFKEQIVELKAEIVELGEWIKEAT